MPISRRQYHRQYLQSVSYLAFTGARADESCVIDRLDSRNPRLVERGETEEPTDDALAPARGILNGLRMSLLLWGVIGLAFLLMR
jgi:hypothetical protein